MTDLSSALRPIVILEFLSKRPGGATLRELRDELEIPRSSVWLLVRQLEEGGFISKSGSGIFVPGSRLLQMGLSLYQQASMGGDARMVLQRLSTATGLDVYLAIRTGDSVVYADRVFGANSVQLRRQLGEPRPLHASAAGKLFLAYDADGLWQQYIAGHELKRFTPQTITDHGALRAQLEKIRKDGYVDADSEVLLGISSLGCMVFNPDGSPWAAVIISAHESDLDPKRAEVLEQLIETCAALTKARADLAAG